MLFCFKIGYLGIIVFGIVCRIVIKFIMIN